MRNKILKEIFPQVKEVCQKVTGGKPHTDDLIQELMIVLSEHKNLEYLYKSGELKRYIFATAYKMYYTSGSVFFRKHISPTIREVELDPIVYKIQEPEKEPEAKEAIKQIFKELSQKDRLWMESLLKHNCSYVELSRASGIHRNSISERVNTIYDTIRNS